MSRTAEINETNHLNAAPDALPTVDAAIARGRRLRSEAFHAALKDLAASLRAPATAERDAPEAAPLSARGLSAA